jgi:organic hydroperoxide reductase OsmC/OhrA
MVWARERTRKEPPSVRLGGGTPYQSAGKAQRQSTVQAAGGLVQKLRTRSEGSETEPEEMLRPWVAACYQDGVMRSIVLQAEGQVG